MIDLLISQIQNDYNQLVKGMRRTLTFPEGKGPFVAACLPAWLRTSLGRLGGKDPTWPLTLMFVACRALSMGVLLTLVLLQCTTARVWGHALTVSHLNAFFAFLESKV